MMSVGLWAIRKTAYPIFSICIRCCTFKANQMQTMHACLLETVRSSIGYFFYLECRWFNCYDVVIAKIWKLLFSYFCCCSRCFLQNKKNRCKSVPLIRHILKYFQLTLGYANDGIVSASTPMQNTDDDYEKSASLVSTSILTAVVTDDFDVWSTSISQFFFSPFQCHYSWIKKNNARKRAPAFFYSSSSFLAWKFIEEMVFLYWNFWNGTFSFYKYVTLFIIPRYNVRTVLVLLILFQSTADGGEKPPSALQSVRILCA